MQKKLSLEALKALSEQDQVLLKGGGGADGYTQQVKSIPTTYSTVTFTSMTQPSDASPDADIDQVSVDIIIDN